MIPYHIFSWKKHKGFFSNIPLTNPDTLEKKQNETSI